MGNQKPELGLSMQGGRVGSDIQGPPTTLTRSRQPGGTRSAPTLGTGHLPGDKPRLGGDVDPSQPGPWPGRAVGSQRLALLQHCCRDR